VGELSLRQGNFTAVVERHRYSHLIAQRRENLARFFDGGQGARMLAALLLQLAQVDQPDGDTSLIAQLTLDGDGFL
jgi:hypothetical protein